jgi:hypothetical protein
VDDGDDGSFTQLKAANIWSYAVSTFAMKREHMLHVGYYKNSGHLWYKQAAHFIACILFCQHLSQGSSVL